MKKQWIWLAAVLTVLLLCVTALAESAMIYTDPRKTLPAGTALDFGIYGFDQARDQYARVLRREADGSLDTVAVVKAWDAAEKKYSLWIGANVINDPGEYWLTLGPDPDYDGIETARVAVCDFTVLSEGLAKPVFQNVQHGASAGSDITGSVTVPKGTEMCYIEAGRIVDGRFIGDYWTTDDTFSILGLYTGQPGTYQIRATAYTHYFGGEASETVADSETAIYEFTLEPAVIPDCPTPIVDREEADYDPDNRPSFTLTLPGAEAITWQMSVYNPINGMDIAGQNPPETYTLGDTDTVFLWEEAGEYHITVWARINGLWSRPGEVVFMLNPLGYLDPPAVQWQGQDAGDTLTVSADEALVFSVSCENAARIYCEVMEYLDDGDMDWLDSIGENGETVVFDLTGMNLAAGSYRLRFDAYKDGWISTSDTIVRLTIGESNAAASGVCGENLAWTLDREGVLTITGTGDMADYSYSAPAPWNEYQVKEAVFQEGVASVGDWAFFGMRSLQSVSFPETLTVIGANAFQACGGLAGTLEIPEGVTRIENNGFFRCSGLTGLVLPGSLQFIGESAFMNCGLASVDVYDGVAAKEHVFYYGAPEEPEIRFAVRVSLPAGVADVHRSAFSFCNFQHVQPDFVSPSSLTTVQAEAFSGTDFTFVWLTDQVTAIRDGAFSACPNLRYVRIPDHCAAIGANAFPAGTVLLGLAGSEAETYAEENGYTFLPVFVGWGNG